MLVNKLLLEISNLIFESVTRYMLLLKIASHLSNLSVYIYSCMHADINNRCVLFEIRDVAEYNEYSNVLLPFDFHFTTIFPIQV
jgi:hypothetical protein